jgi:endonuclease YncB( thermonuclease family)
MKLIVAILRIVGQLGRMLFLLWMLPLVWLITSPSRYKSWPLRLLCLALFVAVLVAPVLGGRWLYGRLTAPPVLVPVQATGNNNGNTATLPVLKAGSVAMEEGTIVGMVNGDTIDIEINGQMVRVQLLGVDAPERGDCYYHEAAATQNALIQSGQRVRLEGDLNAPNTDRFGRLWRYLWLADGRMINEQLVRDGVAITYKYFVESAYHTRFTNAEVEAQAARRGMWSVDNCVASFRKTDFSLQPAYSVAMPTGLDLYPVSRVIDGDTIEIIYNGQAESVRFVGIDTAESGQCFAADATQRVTDLLTETGNQVYLEYDANQNRRDHYGRLLAFLWLPDGRSLQWLLLTEGYAMEYTFRLPYRYQAQFKQAEFLANLGGLGLWSPTTCNGKTGDFRNRK